MDKSMNEVEEEEKKLKAKLDSERQRGLISGCVYTAVTLVALISIIFLILVNTKTLVTDSTGSWVFLSKTGKAQYEANQQFYAEASDGDKTGTGNSGSDSSVNNSLENPLIGNAVATKLNVIDERLRKSSYYANDYQDAMDKIYKAYFESYNDKYSVYYTADEYKKIQEQNSGQIKGIGIYYQKPDNDYITVTGVMKDTPAKAAGLEAGDIIMAVDGQDVKAMSTDETSSIIRGAEGTKVKISYKRGNQTYEVDVTRALVNTPTVSAEMLEGDIGYIAISGFETVTTEQFNTELDKLLNDGAKGIIFDVRNNSGGSLSVVYSILDRILPEDLIFYTKDRNGTQTNFTGMDGKQLDIPYVVLANENSASLAEIFTSAIKDYGYGTFVGKTTYGKGIVQQIVPFSDGSAIKYTVSEYFTKSGNEIHKNGVNPDETVELDYENMIDTQFDRAYEIIEEKLK